MKETVVYYREAKIQFNC